MPRDTMMDLSDHLFAQLERLEDDDYAGYIYEKGKAVMVSRDGHRVELTEWEVQRNESSR